MQTEKILAICEQNTADLYAVFDVLPADAQPAILMTMVHIARHIERELADEQALAALDRPSPVRHNWAFGDILELGAWLTAKLGVKLDDPGATVSVAIEQLQALNAELAKALTANVDLATKINGLELQLKNLDAELDANQRGIVEYGQQTEQRIKELERQLEAANSRPVTLTVAATTMPSNGHDAAPSATTTGDVFVVDAESYDLLQSIHFADEALREAAIELANGSKVWRDLPATQRRGIALHLIPAIVKDKPTILQYDSYRPAWMPTSQTIAALFGMRWSQVVDQALRVGEPV